jgi:hypothetical protein
MNCAAIDLPWLALRLRINNRRRTTDRRLRLLADKVRKGAHALPLIGDWTGQLEPNQRLRAATALY